MAEFVAFRHDIKTLGQSTAGIIQAMGAFGHIAEKILAKHGIGRIRPEEWYPQQLVLNALKAAAEGLGENTIFAIGKKIADVARWPPDIRDVHAALESANVAYHMNHRDDAGPLFDPATGTMREGIGYYAYRRQGPRAAAMECKTPYPSEMDRGIVVGVARRFRPLAQAELDPSAPSRKRGDDSCTFIVTW